MTDTPSPQNRRVLLVDDNRAIHDDFRKILCSAGAATTALDASADALFGSATESAPRLSYEIDSAYQGEEAATMVGDALAAGRPYAMAFVDVRMPPGWDGVETTRRIWRIDPSVQIVLCTAYSDYSWDEVFEKLGHTDGLLILKKPFDAVEALQMAQTLTEKWWLHRQSLRKMEDLERMVAGRTLELSQANGALREEVATHRRSQAMLIESNERFQLLTENITDAFWIAPPDLRGVRYLSPAFERIWGRSRQEIAASLDHGAGHVFVEDRARVTAALAGLAADAPTIDIEYRIVRPDGEIRWIRSRGFQVRDAANELVSLTGVVTDITSRRGTEESLRLLGSAVEQAGDSIMITDAELDLPGPRILFVNPAFTAMSGYSAAEAIGQTPRMMQGPRTDRRLLDRLRQTLRRGESFEGEAVNYRKDGAEFILSWRITPLRDASGFITHFLAIQRDVTESKRIENALVQSNERFQQIADNITDAFWIRSPDMREVRYISPAFERIWGRSAGELREDPAKWADFIFPEDRERVQDSFLALACEGQKLDLEYRIVRPGGELCWVHVRGFQARNVANELVSLTGVVTDVTERKRLENQLFQSQKMETVGRLAGGVAHEFNSILTAIIGQSELLLGDLPVGSPLAESAREIGKAAGRAAVLTRQLLAYGRKQFLRPEVLNLNRIVAGMQDMFKHLLGVNVEASVILAPTLQAVRADAGQIEQVILNMVANARDAMPNGGKLILETANIAFKHDSVGRYEELKEGDYVMLAITDTGVGMTPEVRARAFEPFFTTKEVGEGTGLGLSTCYGIVKQSGGHISVYSELARGTVFKIYLPAVAEEAAVAVQRPGSSELPRGHATILLVEDDPALREMAGSLLRRLGYTVLTAANGLEALSLTQRRDTGYIDLLFTDVVMPHMSGKELSERLSVSHPHMRTLFTSAFTENAILQQGALNKGVALLPKPFSPSALARKLREMLDPP